MIIGKEKSDFILQYPVTAEDISEVIGCCCSLEPCGGTGYTFDRDSNEIDVSYHLEFSFAEDEENQIYIDSARNEIDLDDGYSIPFDFGKYEPEGWDDEREEELDEARDEISKNRKRYDDLWKAKKRYEEDKKRLEAEMYEDACEMIYNSEGNAEGFKGMCEYFAEEINNTIEKAKKIKKGDMIKLNEGFLLKSERKAIVYEIEDNTIGVIFIDNKDKTFYKTYSKKDIVDHLIDRAEEYFQIEESEKYTDDFDCITTVTAKAKDGAKVIYTRKLWSSEESMHIEEAE